MHGTWKGDVQMWMDPDGPPIANEAVAEVTRIMGGRYLEWKQVGTFAGFL